MLGSFHCSNDTFSTVTRKKAIWQGRHLPKMDICRLNVMTAQNRRKKAAYNKGKRTWSQDKLAKA